MTAAPYENRNRALTFSSDDVNAIRRGEQYITVRLAAHRSAEWKPLGKLWVQEKFGYEGRIGSDFRHARDKYSPTLVRYWASDENRAQTPLSGWRAPKELPRWGSRISLLVKSVRLCLLLELTEHEAQGAGCNGREEFAHLWNLRHPEIIWSDNPWVVVLRFKAFSTEK